jgi:hypothetical protein
MASLELKVPMEIWTAATWENFIQIAANPASAKLKSYYHNGRILPLYEQSIRQTISDTSRKSSPECFAPRICGYKFSGNGLRIDAKLCAEYPGKIAAIAE